MGFLLSADAVLGASVVGLDIEWGRGGRTDWSGDLSVEGGRVLSTEPAWLEGEERVNVSGDGRAVWTSVTAGATDGIRVRVETGSAGVLAVHTGVGTENFSIADVLRGPVRRRVGESRRVIEVRRTLRDVIRLVDSRAHYVFAPGEVWNFGWRLNPGVSLPDGMILDYTLDVVDDRTSGQSLLERRGKVPAAGDAILEVQESVAVPAADGIYSLVLRVEGAPIEVPPLRTQFVVVDPAPRAAAPAGASRRRADHVDAAAPAGPERYRDDGSARIVERGVLKYRATGTGGVKHHGGREHKPSASWMAWRLHVEHPGRAHVLEITYPLDARRRFVASILEEQRPGRSRNSIDAGIVVRQNEIQAGGLARKRIVFWPVTEAPALAIVNTLPGSDAAVAAIEVVELPGGLPEAPPPAASRMRGLYLEEPQLARWLGGSYASDDFRGIASARRTDWVTFYDALEHLAALLKHRGDNALLLPVFAYGGSLYPSQRLGNNARYDNGFDFSDGRDPVQKDVVRLLLRIFEREGLTLVPVFVFYTALPGLEARYAGAAEPRPIDLVHRSGRSAREELTFAGSGDLGPRYNPLNPEVQDEIRAIVRAFVDRYRDSTALGDVAVQINPTGWTQFPGLSWGYDAPTVNAFLESRGAGQVSFPYAGAADAWQRLTAGETRKWWTDWRNGRLAEFYGSLAATVREADPGRRLVLVYMNTFTGRFAEDDPAAALAAGRTPRDLLAVKGVDPVILAAQPGIRIWRGLRTPVPMHRFGEKTSAVSYSPAVRALFESVGADGVVEFHNYRETRVPSLERNWWWPIDYRMVATFARPNEGAPEPALPVFFTGGWQAPQ